MSTRQIVAAPSMLLMLVVTAACAAAPRERPVKLGAVDTGAGTLAAARQYLEGRWTLESFEVHQLDKAPLTLTGQGTLHFDEFGNLQMEIRADEETATRLRAAGIAVHEGVISTSGRTVVDMQHRTLTYVVDGQTPATTGPLALSRPRHWTVDRNVLTLTTKDASGQPLSVGRWRKLP